MRVLLCSPILAEFINNPTGMVLIAALVVAAFVRGKI